jgi:cytochrome c553
LSRLVSISSDPDGLRTNDNGVIAPAAKNLSDEQIEALAHYLTSL